MLQTEEDWTVVTSGISVTVLCSEGSGDSCWLNYTWAILKLRWEVLEVQITPWVTLLFIACTALSSILANFKESLWEEEVQVSLHFYFAVQCSPECSVRISPDTTGTVWWEMILVLKSCHLNGRCWEEFELGHEGKKKVFQAQINCR